MVVLSAVGWIGGVPVITAPMARSRRCGVTPPSARPTPPAGNGYFFSASLPSPLARAVPSVSSTALATLLARGGAGRAIWKASAPVPWRRVGRVGGGRRRGQRHFHRHYLPQCRDAAGRTEWLPPSFLKQTKKKKTFSEESLKKREIVLILSAVAAEQASL